MKRILLITGSLALLLIVGLAVTVYAGWYNVGADRPHFGVTYAILDTVKHRSLSHHAADIDAPDLDGERLLQEGASHYDAMCTGCHLAPGMSSSELREGLYPKPPNLAEHGVEDPAEAFWIIKHGLKYSGMPAWGKTHGDESIWGLVAFVAKMPEMTADDYAASVNAASGGHSHSGGGHSHDHGVASAEDSDGPGHDDGGAGGEDAGGHDHEAGGHHGPGDSASEGHVHTAPDSAEGVLDAFHHALEEGRGEDALAYLAEDVSILEGGHAQDRAQYAGGHLASDMSFLAAVDSQRLSRDVLRGESQVTVITRSRLQGTVGERAVDTTSLETAVLELRDGKWVIRHLHWSS